MVLCWPTNVLWYTITCFGNNILQAVICDSKSFLFQASCCCTQPRSHTPTHPHTRTLEKVGPFSLCNQCSFPVEIASMFHPAFDSVEVRLTIALIHARWTFVTMLIRNALTVLHHLFLLTSLYVDRDQILPRTLGFAHTDPTACVIQRIAGALLVTCCTDSLEGQLE